jgi:hypothetical protein
LLTNIIFKLSISFLLSSFSVSGHSRKIPGHYRILLN